MSLLASQFENILCTSFRNSTEQFKKRSTLSKGKVIGYQLTTNYELIKWVFVPLFVQHLV